MFKINVLFCRKNVKMKYANARHNRSPSMGNKANLRRVTKFVTVGHSNLVTRLSYFAALWLIQTRCRLHWNPQYTSNQCYKTCCGGNLDKKLNVVCSNVWTCTKMWKQWGYFLAKLSSKILLLLKWSILVGLGRRKSRFPPLGVQKIKKYVFHCGIAFQILLQTSPSLNEP